jgi:cell wall-associated NlpC family hydrolase
LFIKSGVNILFDSWQAEAGQVSVSLMRLPGDLVFFDDERGRITHVGMILSKDL